MQPPVRILNPNAPLVPTSDLAATLAEYRAQGFHCAILYVGKFYPAKCDGKLWAAQFYRPRPAEQPELIPLPIIPFTSTTPIQPPN